MNSQPSTTGSSWTGQTLTSFSQFFFKLPPELRVKVWKFNICEPRVIELEPNSNYDQIVTRTKTPGYLQACRESRFEGLKVYELLGSDPGFNYSWESGWSAKRSGIARIFIHFEIDTVYFRSEMFTTRRAVELVARGIPIKHEKVLKMGFHYTGGAGRNSFTEDLRKYTGLERLSVTFDEPYMTGPLYDEGHLRDDIAYHRRMLQWCPSPMEVFADTVIQDIEEKVFWHNECWHDYVDEVKYGDGEEEEEEAEVEEGDEGAVEDSDEEKAAREKKDNHQSGDGLIFEESVERSKKARERLDQLLDQGRANRNDIQRTRRIILGGRILQEEIIHDVVLNFEDSVERSKKARERLNQLLDQGRANRSDLERTRKIILGGRILQKQIFHEVVLNFQQHHLPYHYVALYPERFRELYGKSVERCFRIKDYVTRYMHHGIQYRKPEPDCPSKTFHRLDHGLVRKRPIKQCGSSEVFVPGRLCCLASEDEFFLRQRKKEDPNGREKRQIMSRTGLGRPFSSKRQSYISQKWSGKSVGSRKGIQSGKGKLSGPIVCRAARPALVRDKVILLP